MSRAEKTTPTVVKPTPHGSESDLKRTLQALQCAVAEQSGGTFSAVALGLACPVDTARGIITHGGKIGLHAGANLAALASDATGLPAFIRTELAMACLGEHRFGAGKGRKNLVVLTVGTGVGAGVVIDGMLYRGSNGVAGEIGHVPVDLSASAKVCRTCGRKGCLEAYASSAALLERGVGEHWQTANDVAAAAERGEPRAIDAIKVTAEMIGVVMALCVNTFDPEILVLRGGTARAVWPVGGASARKIFTSLSLSSQTPVEFSPLGEDGVFWGLAAEWPAFCSNHGHEA